MAFKKGKPNEWKSDNFKYAFVFTAAALMVYLIAFASPYWLQLYATVPYDFKNMGLWEICLSNYVFREDGYIRVFDGCYWSFSIQLEDRRNIFNPGKSTKLARPTNLITLNYSHKINPTEIIYAEDFIFSTHQCIHS